MKSFNEFVNEAIGADSMEKDPADMILSPDTRRSSAIMFYQGTSGAIPTHWNNSPFLSGSRLTSAFGANPRASKKKAVLSYHEFIKTAKSAAKSK